MSNIFLTPTDDALHLENHSDSNPLLIARYILCRTDEEFHWVQRWVEVRHKTICTFVKRGELPLLQLEVPTLEITDEGDRHFSVSATIGRDELDSSLLEFNPVVAETSDDSGDERVPLDASDEPVPLRPTTHQARTLRFRCCGRIECVEMLQSVEFAIRSCRVAHVATQTCPSHHDFMEMPLHTFNALMEFQGDLAVENHRLACQALFDRVQWDTERAQWEAERSSMSSQFLTAAAEAKRRLDAKQRQLIEEREKLTASISSRYQDQLRALELRLDEARDEATSATRSLSAEKEALRRQIEATNSARQMKARSFNTDGAITGLDKFLRIRRDHLTWLRHHLCSEQIARFALSLKRAGQILARIPGSAQFAKEFGHEWPIAARLIELPAMIAEEDKLLADILDVYRGKRSGGSGSLQKCPSPACGGEPLEHHACCRELGGDSSILNETDAQDTNNLCGSLRLCGSPKGHSCGRSSCSAAPWSSPMREELTVSLKSPLRCG